MQKNTQKPLKIAFVVDDGLDRPDGVQQYVLTIGEWLAERGHDVHYIAGQTQRTDITHVHSMSRNLQVKFNGNGLSTPLPAPRKKIRELLSNENFDVIHVQVPYSPFMAAKVVSNAGERSVIIGTFHILPFGFLSKIGNYLLGFWLRRNLRLFDAHIAVSKPAQTFSRKTFGINSVVIPNAVNIDLFKSNDLQATVGEVSTPMRIVFLGRLVGRKGCMELLKAVSFIKDTIGSVKVDIYGRGPQLGELQSFTQDHELTDIVTFHGYVSEHDKSSVLANADIAVFPSLAGESFGIVLIEAMASGAGVVLGGDNPGYRSVLADETVLFDPRDTEQFAKTLKRFVDDEKLRTVVHHKQQELVKKYDVSVVGKRIEDMYKDCISNKRRG